MKKIVAFVVVVVLTLLISVFAVDRKLSDYVTHGAFDYHVVDGALDSSYTTKQKVAACIDSMSTIAKRPLHVPITFSASDQGSTYNYVMTVPVGMTATLNALTISAHVPPLGKVGSDTIFLLMYFYDASEAAMTKYTTTQRLSDSAEVTTLPGILVADSTEVISVDSVSTFAAGDVVYIATYVDSGGAGGVSGCGVTFDLDMDE